MVLEEWKVIGKQEQTKSIKWQKPGNAKQMNCRVEIESDLLSLSFVILSPTRAGGELVVEEKDDYFYDTEEKRCENCTKWHFEVKSYWPNNEAAKTETWRQYMAKTDLIADA